MIKTLNSCHFDQALKEQTLYCEPLMNALPNFQLKLCFGFHYGSAIEGIQLYLIAVLKNAIRYFFELLDMTQMLSAAGIIGSNFRFESCFTSLNSDFQATLQVCSFFSHFSYLECNCRSSFYCFRYSCLFIWISLALSLIESPFLYLVIAFVLWPYFRFVLLLTYGCAVFSN